MDLFLAIVLILLAAIIGALIGWLATRGTFSSRVSRLETELESARREAEVSEQERNAAREELSNAFKAIGADVLRSNSEEFLRNARQTFQNLMTESKGDLEKRQQAIESLVKPISDSLKEVDGKINELEKNRAGAYEGLIEQVRAMQEANEKLRLETTTLSRALGKTTTQGQWGELQLRRVVELAGMVEHVDFDEQVNIGEGNRPDMIVHLSGGKQIVVDAKAPMDEYYLAANAENETIRKQHLKSHAANVRSRVIGLSAKEYHSRLEQTPEFVVMFLPSDPFLTEALNEEPGLFEFALDKGVIITTPATLIALLKAVALGWRQEAIEKNAREIAEQGRELHNRVGTLAGHFANLGGSINNVVKHYNSTLGSMERNVLPAVRRLEEMGASSSKKIEDFSPIEGQTRETSSPELLSGEAEEDAE